MKPLQVSEDILPVAHFKARASEVLRKLREQGRPVIITQNGRPAGVLISPEDFDRLAYRERVVAAVEEGLAQADAGMGISDEELGRRLDEEFGALKE